MKDRNSTKEIKRDISFLSEMYETADKALNFTGKYQGHSDLGSSNHLMTLINDWKDELKKMLDNNLNQKTGIQSIAEERARQISQEGWTPEHDDGHKENELALAAACYAIPEERRVEKWGVPEKYWMWDVDWWKPCPENRIKELQKAGALIAAEIDRLLRIKDNNNG